MIMLFPVNPVTSFVRVKEGEAVAPSYQSVVRTKSWGHAPYRDSDQRRLAISPRPEASFAKWRKTSPIRFRFSETGPGQGVKVSLLRKLCRYTRRQRQQNLGFPFFPLNPEASVAMCCLNGHATTLYVHTVQPASTLARINSLSYKVGGLPSDRR
jgi:hypothetical protein